MARGVSKGALDAADQTFVDHFDDEGEDLPPAAGITVEDPIDMLDADNVEAALLEILYTFQLNHYLGNQSNPGQHRAIHQPDLGNGRVLLFFSRGNGTSSAQFRIYADNDNIWFTMNAEWDEDDDRWEKDAPGRSGGFRFSRGDIEFMTDNAGANTFTDWERTWRLPMERPINSAFETSGTIREVGRIALQATNTYSSARVVSMGIPVTFRNRFPPAPSSITFSAESVSDNWVGTPTVNYPSRDGFIVYSYQQTLSQRVSFWYGSYTAIA